jgi:hypothetical protein
MNECMYECMDDQSKVNVSIDTARTIQCSSPGKMREFELREGVLRWRPSYCMDTDMTMFQYPFEQRTAGTVPAVVCYQARGMLCNAITFHDLAGTLC